MNNFEQSTFSGATIPSQIVVPMEIYWGAITFGLEQVYNNTDVIPHTMLESLSLSSFGQLGWRICHLHSMVPDLVQNWIPWKWFYDMWQRGGGWIWVYGRDEKWSVDIQSIILQVH